MATIHCILQGKGGMGKSMIAVMLYQALQHCGKEVLAYDTDPVNATLSSFKEFNVASLDVMKDGNIDARKFDVRLGALVNAPEESHVIVDNGASSFIALGAYLAENDFLPLLEEQGHRVFFHSIVTGGQALGDTNRGLVCTGGRRPLLCLRPSFSGRDRGRLGTLSGQFCRGPG